MLTRQMLPMLNVGNNVCCNLNYILCLLFNQLTKDANLIIEVSYQTSLTERSGFSKTKLRR